MSAITETSAGCPRSELDPFSDEFLADPFPFHPTGVGMIRLASSVVRIIKPAAGG